ncbi:MAG: FHA domain-containing protein [Pirellulales bacterium]
MEVRLVILSSSGRPSKDLRLSLPAVIGRGEGVSLRLKEDSVSRRHCEVIARDGTVVIRDLGSTNGTRVEGVHLEPNVEREIDSGTILEIVGYRIMVEYGAGGTTVAAPLDVSESAERKTVPLAETPAVADDERQEEPPEAPTLEAAPAGDDGFGFLGATEPAATAADGESPQWPVSDAPEPPAADDLDNFFKSLS